VGLITLNRPRVHNAINGEMAGLLERLVKMVEADGSIRVVVLAAAGKSFCAGADLSEVAAGRANELRTAEGGFAGFVFAPRTKPWIAAVQGAAHGGGTEIALACDMVVAGKEATFGLTEAKRGLIAGGGGCYRLARTLPPAIAIELVTTGVPITAPRAYELGLVNRVVDTTDVTATAMLLASAIAANSPLSVRESLQLVRAAVNVGEPLLRTLQDAAMERVLAGPDVIEGASAFVEKRTPVWRS
jgi:enoyl-CoA hydratase/carnithine racemase